MKGDLTLRGCVPRPQPLERQSGKTRIKENPLIVPGPVLDTDTDHALPEAPEDALSCVCAVTRPAQGFQEHLVGRCLREDWF